MTINKTINLTGRFIASYFNSAVERLNDLIEIIVMRRSLFVDNVFVYYFALLNTRIWKIQIGVGASRCLETRTRTLPPDLAFNLAFKSCLRLPLSLGMMERRKKISQRAITQASASDLT